MFKIVNFCLLFIITETPVYFAWEKKISKVRSQCQCPWRRNSAHSEVCATQKAQTSGKFTTTFFLLTDRSCHFPMTCYTCFRHVPRYVVHSGHFFFSGIYLSYSCSVLTLSNNWHWITSSSQAVVLVGVALATSVAAVVLYMENFTKK